jgi:hypothetical protein
MRNVLVVAALTLMGVNAAAQDIIKADYSEPTQPYRHGVLGDDIEWASLTVVTDEGKTLTYSIPDEFVFEDISPRLADIDQDGNREAWVIRSDDIDARAWKPMRSRKAHLSAAMLARQLAKASAG